MELVLEKCVPVFVKCFVRILCVLVEDAFRYSQSFCILIEIFALWFFSVPMTYIAANVLHLPFLVVYAIMYICEDLPKSVVLIFYWISGKWIRPVTQVGKAALAEFKKDE
jgi:Na+-driven multidrug efflux pump